MQLEDREILSFKLLQVKKTKRKEKPNKSYTVKLSTETFFGK